MKLPLRVRAGIEDVPLSEDAAVVAKVAGVEVEWAYSLGGGIWSMHVPVAVADSRSERRRLAPVVDISVAMGVAVGLLWLVAAIRGRSKSDGRREPVPAGG